MLKRGQGWMIILFRVVTTMNNLQVCHYLQPSTLMDGGGRFFCFVSVITEVDETPF